MSADSTPPLVSARGLAKAVAAPGGRLSILESVELSVSAGEAVAILGASGSGKSTLLGLLAGLDDCSRGEIRLFGHPLPALNEDERAALRAAKVGFVFQSFQLLPTLTALENVLLPLELVGISEARSAAGAALDAVGLRHRAEHYPRQLSGGEQQRVAIARAFAPRPRILFADEPTGNLDQTTGDGIVDLLLDLRAGTGAALVMATHDQRLAARCDRRLLLDGGRLRETR